MCLILFSHEIHHRYRLIFAANRDEFYDRPTLPAQFWNNSPNLLAGKDLKEGGTWMGITRTGRFAAITNFREPANAIENGPSRGFLVLDFLERNISPEQYLSDIKMIGGRYNGFNLLVGTHDNIFYFSNRQNKIINILPGIYGLSNHLINTAWPKVTKGMRFLAKMTSKDNFPDIEEIFSLLQDRSKPPDHQLPSTGVSPEWEKVLSPLFITSPTYGTRSSTILLWDRNGTIDFYERTFTPSGEDILGKETRTFRFHVQRVFK